MKKVAYTALYLAVASSAAQAVEVAPGEVVADAQGYVAQPLTDMPGDVANGRKLMSDRGAANCVACHAVTELSDVPFHGEVGPVLDGVATRYPEAMIRGILVNSKKVFPDSVMPSYYRVDGFNRPGIEFTSKPIEGEIQPLLTGQQIEDVVAYLMTLKQ